MNGTKLATYPKHIADSKDTVHDLADVAEHVFVTGVIWEIGGAKRDPTKPLIALSVWHRPFICQVVFLSCVEANLHR